MFWNRAHLVFSQGMALKQDIVITGAGVVSPIGIGKDPFWAAMCQGQSGIRRLDLFDDPSLPAPIGGTVADFDPKQYVRPRKSLKVMSRDIQLAFAAADLACVDAGIPEHAVDPERFGVVFGASLIPGELNEIASTYQNCAVDGKFDFSRWGPTAMAELFPLWMLKYLPNMPACHIGIAQDARGPNNSITMGDVSSLSALAEAVRILERGQADALIVGGVGMRLHPVCWARHDVKDISHRADNPSAASRPFDADRDGMVNGEGAAAFLLETRSHAEARGVPILARILGYASAFEGSGATPDKPSASANIGCGNAIRRAIGAALRDAGVTPAELGFVVAHGKSTIDDDRVEAQAIRSVLGDVPVTASKGNFGYLAAASGALETAVGILSIQHGQIPPTLNYEHPDPECPINVVHGRPMPLRCPTALVLTHSPFGQAVAVVLGGANGTASTEAMI
jgi:3-oxoacyl-[acyl-carrier-protein] synthase II